MITIDSIYEEIRVALEEYTFEEILEFNDVTMEEIMEFLVLSYGLKLEP